MFKKGDRVIYYNSNNPAYDGQFATVQVNTRGRFTPVIFDSRFSVMSMLTDKLFLIEGSDVLVWLRENK